MSGIARTTAFVFIALACLASGAAAQALDTSRLPRLPGAKEIFASAATTIYVSPDSVAQTAEATRKALGALGWQAYVAPHAARAQNPTMEIMTFKKGPQALNVFITIAPAQGNATSVNYSPLPLATDLPFPKNASEIEFDPNRPLLLCMTTDSVDRVLDEYRRELDVLGWSLWSAKIGGKAPAGAPAGETTDKGAYAYYIRDNSKPLILVLQRGDDGRTKVKIESVPADVLAAAREAELNRNRPPAVAVPSPPPARSEPQRSAADDMMDAVMKEAMQTMRDGLSDARKGATPPPAPKIAAADETLRARAGGETPIPVPETAEDVEYEAGDGKLEFSSPSSVRAVAAFYRAAMKPLGWREHTTPINRANMVALQFSKGDKTLSLTIMQMGNRSNVTADGSGLVTAAAKPDAADSAQPSGAPATVSESDLEAEESGGLPVPKRHTMTLGERTPFRQQLTANLPMDVATVLGFYRRELGKRDWKEQGNAAVAADRASVAFASPDGPAVLTLGRKEGETTVLLVVRHEAKAKEAGVVAKPGQARIILGNMVEAEAVITINKRALKIGAGVGQKKPDGPSIDLPPGTYKFTMKTAGQPVRNDEVTVGAGETWGLLVGPGGVLPLHVY